MLKKLFFLVLTVSFILSCGTKTEQITEKVTELTISQAIQQAEQLIDKPVKLEGTVVHICKHGGKRMFLTGDDSTGERLKITTGENVAAFEMTLEGSVVIVEGVVREQRIDAAYLDQREADLAANVKSEKGEVEHEGKEHAPEHAGEGQEHDQDGEDDHHDKEQELAKLKALRDKLAESGKDYLAFYSVECKKITEKK